MVRVGTLLARKRFLGTGLALLIPRLVAFSCVFRVAFPIPLATSRLCLRLRLRFYRFDSRFSFLQPSLPKWRAAHTKNCVA